jgi:hypothetical protein
MHGYGRQFHTGSSVPALRCNTPGAVGSKPRHHCHTAKADPVCAAQDHFYYIFAGFHTAIAPDFNLVAQAGLYQGMVGLEGAAPGACQRAVVRGGQSESGGGVSVVVVAGTLLLFDPMQDIDDVSREASYGAGLQTVNLAVLVSRPDLPDFLEIFTRYGI